MRSIPRSRRRLARQAAAALDELDAALGGEDPIRATAAAAIVALLDRRSLHRDVRPELIAAAAVLRLPPARPIRRGMTPGLTPTPGDGMRRGATADLATAVRLSVERRAATA